VKKKLFLWYLQVPNKLLSLQLLPKTFLLSTQHTQHTYLLNIVISFAKFGDLKKVWLKLAKRVLQE
jgi:hypothetical protein